MTNVNIVLIFMNSNKLFKISENYECFKNLLQQFQFAVESLMYIMLRTCLNITFIVFVINCYIFNLFKAYFKAVKKIFCYFKNTAHYCLIFHKNLQSLTDYTNSD